MKRMLVAAASLLAAAAFPAAAQTLAQVQLGDDYADMLQTAADNIARMKAAHKQVADRVDEARSEKDVVKLNCVNEKLTQVKGLLKVAEQAEAALREAVAAKDEGADAEYAKIGIARSKVEGLRGEADQCTGQLAYMVDEKTTVEVEQPSTVSTEQALSLNVAIRGGETEAYETFSEPDESGLATDNLGNTGGAGTSATVSFAGDSSKTETPSFNVTVPPAGSPY